MAESDATRHMNDNTHKRGDLRAWIVLFAILILSTGFLLTELSLELVADGSLCPTVSCKIAGEYVRHGSKFMVGIGSLFFTFLLVLSWSVFRYRSSRLEDMLACGFFAGLAFDGGIIGFQRYGIQGTCYLCLATAALILLSFMVYSYARRAASMAIIGLIVWTAAFGANKIIRFPQGTPTLEKVTICDQHTGIDQFPKYYLFFKMSCDHCNYVITALAHTQSKISNWHLASLDADTKDLHRLAGLFVEPDIGENPFSRLLKDEIGDNVQYGDVLKSIAGRTEKAQSFIINSGYQELPVLIVQESRARRLYLSGREEVMKYLTESGLIAVNLSALAGTD